MWTYDVDCEDGMPPHVDASEDVPPCEDDVLSEIHDTLLEAPKQPPSQVFWRSETEEEVKF